MSHKTQFFTDDSSTPSNPTPSTAQQRGLFGKAWDGVKWTVGGTAWLASRPFAWGFSPVGEGLGSGLVSGAKKEFETLVQPDGPMGVQLKQTLEQALLKQAPEQLLQLRAQFQKLLTAPDTLTADDVINIHANLKLLAADDWKLLKQISPKITREAIEFCTVILNFFKLPAENRDFMFQPNLLQDFIRECKITKIREQLIHFYENFNKILNDNQGALIHSLAYLQQALLSEESGILNQAVDLLKRKCTDEDTGLMKQVVSQLTALLSKKGGPIDIFSSRLSEGDESVIAKAVSLLTAKLLDKGGVVDKLGERFNHEETGIIAEALKIARKSFDEILKDGLLLLKNELTSPDGLIAELRKKLSGKDGVLDEAVALLKKSMFDDVEGMVPKLRAELTDKDRGILTESLKLLAKAINDENDGILVQGIGLLKAKLNGEDGVLADSVRLLQHKLNGPEGVVEKLQHRLLNEHDGMLTQALDRVQVKLNDEQTGILAQSVALLEKRLLADEGIVDALGKKLSEPERGILAQAVESLKTSMQKKDGPLDILDQRVQKTLAEALELLSKKCTDENDGMIVKAMTILMAKLTGKGGAVDQLEQRLLEEGTGTLPKMLAILEERLLADEGIVDELSKKLSHPEKGVLVQAVETLKASLQKKDGPLDLLDQRVQKTLADALELLSKKCLDEHDGMIANAMTILMAKLTGTGGAVDQLEQRLLQEDTGTLSKMMAVLEKRLMAENGLLDAMSKRLSDPETGMIAKALVTLNAALEKKDGPLGILNQKVQETLAEALELLSKKCLDEKDGLIASAMTILLAKLTGKGGAVDQLEQRLLEDGTGTLPKMLAILQQRLLADDGIVDELGKKLSHPEKGILAQAVETLKASLQKKDGPLDILDQRVQKTLADALEVLSKKCLDEKDGLIASAMTILMARLTGTGGAVDQLEQRLLQEDTGTLPKMMAVLEKRLMAENGLLDAMSKRLSDPETGMIAKALETLNASLKKKDGPLDTLDQKVQATLAQALDILQKKCLDERDGLLAQGLVMLQKKLNEENGVLDTLSKRLNDPDNGIIAHAINQLNQRLLGENGTFDLLQKKLLDETTGLVPKAVALLQAKVQEVQEQMLKEGGSVDQVVGKLQKRLVDKDGVLDQAMQVLDEHLNHADRGLLIKAKKFLTETLTDEKEGVIAKAIDLLNAKLRAKDGPIDYLEFRLTDKDAGVLSKAVSVLQERLMGHGGVVDQLDERLTGQAHPLLAKSREAFMELRSAIITNNKAAIKKQSQTLESLLDQLMTQQALVFTKKSLDANDLQILQQIRGRLPTYYATAPRSQTDMLVDVEAALGAVNRYYGSYAGIAARTGDILRDTVTGALGPILDRVEQLPKTMVDNLLGRTPSDSSDPTSSTGTEGTVSQFLAHGGSLLKTMLDKGKQAISQQALSSFANVLALGLNQVIGKMEDTPTFERVRSTLTGIVQSLEQTQQTGSWSQLQTQLKEAATALSGVKMYVNGFRVPNIGPSTGTVRSAEVLYSDNMSELQEAIEVAPVEPQSQDWKTLAHAEKDKLVNNTANYLTIKHIYEDVCGLKPVDEKFYMQLLAKAKKNGRFSDTELKKLFFEELGKGKVNLVTRLYARAQYYFYGGIVKRFTAKASTIYFNEIFAYIEKHKGANFESLRNQVTTNFTRYLTILGGAYKNVAKTESPTGTLEEMLKTELEKKQSNLGFETKELYMEFAQNVIQKTLNSGALSWFAKKIIGNPEQIVRSIIDKATSSIQDTRGYTHALNSVILEQLDEVWSLLQSEMAGQSTGRDPIMLAEISEGKKAQLAGLVKNLFEILRKSKCNTVDELRDLVKGKLLSATVNKAVDDLFIEEVLEKVTNILAVTIQSLVKEDQLQKLTFKFASLVNRTFEVGEEVTVEQMQDVERKLAKRSEQILRLTINTAVEEKFDFSGKKQQKETNRFVQELHERSRNYFSTAESDLQTLSTMDISTPEARNKVHKIIEEASAYQSECYESNFQAKSAKMNSDNIDEISERYLGIAEQSKPFVLAVKQLAMHARTLENLGVAVPHLNAVKDIFPAIALRVFRQGAAAREDLDYAENQLSIVETHLAELKKMRSLSIEVEQISARVQEIATIMVTLRKAMLTRELGLKASQPNSIIDQIAAEKKQNLGVIVSNQGLNNKISLLKQELMQSVNTTYLPQLLGKLKNIEEATLTQQVDTAHQEFSALLRQAVEQANTTVDVERQKFWLSYNAIKASIEGTRLLDPSQAQDANRGLQESIRQAQQHLQQLSQWEEQNIKQVPYINFSPVDMKGLQDWASGLVYGRVRERLDGFMGFLKREETYRYGLLNHLFLIPHTQMTRSAKT
ncbi:MAG: hypothetical protein JSS60_03145 [Verrucomicrobia bacterium]|nr:hypothetical protein [Verrucomicrobiota bacterium]